MYAVSGVSGQLGRLAAEQLLSAVPPDQAILLSRDTDALASFAERGAEVRHADFDDTATLSRAFAGVDRLLLVSIDRLGRERVAAQARAIESARAAGVSFVTYTSIPRPETSNPAGVVPDHAAAEDAIRASGMAWTFLRNNVYADFLVDDLRRAGETGQWFTNTGAGATAYVTREDCAAAAIGVLTGNGHEGQAYDVTGPETWSATDLAALAEARFGRPVEVVNVDDAAFATALQNAGLPAELARLSASFGAAGREGYLSSVSDVVSRIGGRPATSIRDLI